MNKFYELVAAGEQLEVEASAQYDGTKQASYLCTLTKENSLHASLQVRYNKDRHQYQLIKEGPGDAPEEVVLRLTGILTHCELPPVLKLPRYPMRLRQATQLTGLDTHKFKAALEGISAISSIFAKYMRSDKLQDWTPDRFQEWTMVGAGNRYFSTGAIAASAEVVPFNNLVDPDGILASVDSKYHHTVDNEVGYFHREQKDDGGFQYTHTNPSNISIGDIVEARLSFLVVSAASGRNNVSKDFKLVIILRSLALINNTFTKKAALALAQAVQMPKHVKTLKRKADFSEDEKET